MPESGAPVYLHARAPSMQQTRLLRTALRVLSGCEAGVSSRPQDVRYLLDSAPELQLKPDFIARDIIEREMRKRLPAEPAKALAAGATE
jgi:hypothetical protein